VVETKADHASVPMNEIFVRSRTLRDLYGADLALIRPDQHIAWRGGDGTDAEAVLKKATGR